MKMSSLSERSGRRFAACLLALASTYAVQSAAGSAERAFTHLDAVMDRYHRNFYVLDDHDSGANHAYPSGWMGDQSALSCAVSSSPVHSGRDSARITFTPRHDTWCGIYYQSVENNWGTLPNGGYDLRGASRVVFTAWSPVGARVEFFAGGITGQYGDSFPKSTLGYVTLSNSPQQYSIDLTSRDLSQVVGPFGFVLNTPNNPRGATFYIDNVYYDKPRLDEARFLASYVTLPSPDPDQFIHNACFTYDQALALLAYLVRGTPDGLRRAKLIADAFVLAVSRDREYADGRLRNAYMKGDLLDHTTGEARLPGWWDSSEQSWWEDRFQVSTYTGNMAWVIISLLAIHQKTGESEYLAAATSMGEWVESHCRDDRGAAGYTGGYLGWEPNPAKIMWKSTEHNIDVCVAFERLYRTTQEKKWAARATHAKRFIESMWNTDDGHFWTGTLDNGVTVNTQTVPLDVQAWAVMAFSNDFPAIGWAEANCHVTEDGFSGFDFNTDRDGLWSEGTAQMALAYLAAGQADKAALYTSELRKIQKSAPNADSCGIVAACHDGLTTGFDWQYFNRLHVGATTWFIFAERGYNPFWGTFFSPRESDLWSDAEDVGEGWKRLDWFGLFSDTYHPWICHREHGWMYPLGSSTRSLLFWNEHLDWLWTGEEVYPFLWQLHDSSVLWYLRGSVNPRLFLNLRTQEWESY